MKNLKSNFRLFWNNKKNCSWEIIHGGLYRDLQGLSDLSIDKIVKMNVFLFLLTFSAHVSFYSSLLSIVRCPIGIEIMWPIIYFQFYYIFRLGQIFGMSPMTSVVPRLQLQYPGIHKVRALLDQKSRIFFKIRTIRIPDFFFPGRRTFKL